MEAALGQRRAANGFKPLPQLEHLLLRIPFPQAGRLLSDERTEFQIKDRLAFARFLALRLADRVLDANTIWMFREAPTRAQINGKPGAVRGAA